MTSPSCEPGLPRRIIFPSSLDELCSAMSELAGREEPGTISGARTGIVGGAVASGGESFVSLERFIFAPGVSFSDRCHAW
jgi:FAD/FMN-containing dehydrogenase